MSRVYITLAALYGVVLLSGSVYYGGDMLNALIPHAEPNQIMNTRITHIGRKRIIIKREPNPDDRLPCTWDQDCNNGACEGAVPADGTDGYCVCDNGYLSVNSSGEPTDVPCDYHQLSWLAALLISIFVGSCGIDRCFIARGNGCHICLGVLKGLTIGGVGIWWLVDMVLIGINDLNDGNGVALYEY